MSPTDDLRHAALRLATALSAFCRAHSHMSEGRRWLVVALRCSEEPPVALRAGALVQAAWLANDQSDFDAAAELAEQSLELFRSLQDGRGIARSLYHLAIVAGHRSEYNRAQALAEESLRLFRDAGDREGVASALEYIGIFTLNQGDYSRARQLLEQSLRLWRELADPWGTAWLLTVSGLAAGRLRDYKAAESYLTEALPLWQELGDQRGRAGCNEFLAEVRQGTGDLASAGACYLEALALFQRAGNKWSIAQCLQKLGTVACAQRKWELAAHYFGAGLALHEAIQAPVNPADSAHFNREIENARGPRRATLRGSLAGRPGYDYRRGGGFRHRPDRNYPRTSAPDSPAGCQGVLRWAHSARNARLPRSWPRDGPTARSPRYWSSPNGL